MDTTAAQAKMEAGIGAALITTPFWVWLLQTTGLIASTIAAVCGAIVGIHAVWRLWKRSRVSQ